MAEDLSNFLRLQKQRQARLETTMRSFPNTPSSAYISYLDNPAIPTISSIHAAQESDKDNRRKKAGENRRKEKEDPLSHRIIEKRRRDRMNNCLADLSRLIPTTYLKKGRIEKTEIIEMAIKHMKHLHQHPCNSAEKCDMADGKDGDIPLKEVNTRVESFRVGYHECLTELMHFLVEKEGLYAGDSFCVRILTQLQKHFDKLGRASNINNIIMTSNNKVQPSTFIPSSVINSEAPSEAESGYTSTATYKESIDEAINMRKPKLEDMLKPKQEEGATVGNQGSTNEEIAKECQFIERVGRQTGDEAEEVKMTVDDFQEKLATSNDKEEANDTSERLMEAGGEAGDVNGGDPSLRYKFKSNIQHRFRQTSMQDRDGECETKGERIRHDTEESFVETSKPNDRFSTNLLETDSLQGIYNKRYNRSVSEERSQAGHGLSEINLGIPRGNVAVIQETLSHSNNEQESSENAQGFPKITISEPKDKNRPLYHPTDLSSDSSPYSKYPNILLEPDIKPSISPNPFLSRSPLCISPLPKPSGHSVPIFALHSKGAYYIPLSIDMSAISSHMSLFSGLEDTSTPLHPITISVNFNRDVPATAPGNVDRNTPVEPPIPRLWSGPAGRLEETKDWNSREGRQVKRREWERRNDDDIGDYDRVRERESRDWDSDRKPHLEDEKQQGIIMQQQQGVIRQHWRAKKLWTYPGTGY